jgi:hypothetical protein
MALSPRFRAELIAVAASAVIGLGVLITTLVR